MLEIVTPSLEDMWFREQLLADEETMSYNHAWGGTVLFPKEDWMEFYDFWVLHPDDRHYYRYLKNDAGEFVGEIAYHYSSEYSAYMINVIIYAPYRRSGYGSEGLDLLCDVAKERGISVLYDDIAIDNPAISMFLAHGFTEVSRTPDVVLLKKHL
ncbi:MAG: GNAT family N-acetyltransferase [Lachnospiraceae bacterium]|nr:GNAT family N-acetyltransferase [Lachnospiraceae bacterium]